jgi:hypothetical protein
MGTGRRAKNYSYRTSRTRAAEGWRHRVFHYLQHHPPAGIGGETRAENQAACYGNVGPRPGSQEEGEENDSQEGEQEEEGQILH